jgi:DNA (cytosine-5)-methyltransferase 1
MQLSAIDLFAGLGGWSTGARMAGVNVLWAANHWQEAVTWHSQNHPDAIHICQDLHQADWSQVPAHDVLLASPCCQGHSKARGKASGNPQHDASRSTAWAVVSALEFHRPQVAIIENVPEFMDWNLFPAWSIAMQALGYQLAPHIVDCADLGVPQNRVRMFLVASRSKAPLFLDIQTQAQHWTGLLQADAPMAAGSCSRTTATLKPADLWLALSARSPLATAGQWSTATGCGC